MKTKSEPIKGSDSFFSGAGGIRYRSLNGRLSRLGGAKEAVAQWAILQRRKRPERVNRSKQWIEASAMSTAPTEIAGCLILPFALTNSPHFRLHRTAHRADIRLVCHVGTWVRIPPAHFVKNENTPLGVFHFWRSGWDSNPRAGKPTN